MLIKKGQSCSRQKKKKKSRVGSTAPQKNRSSKANNTPRQPKKKMKLWPRRNQKNEKVQRENKQIKDIRGKQRKLSLQSNLCLELSAVGLPVKLKRYVTVSVKNFIILKKGWFSASTVWIGSISLVSGTQVLPKNWKKSVLLVQLV